MIILLSGYKGSGKDLLANTMVKELSFKRVGFADTLKDMAADQYGIERSSLDDPERKESPILHLPVLSKDRFTKNLHAFMFKEFRTEAGFQPTDFSYDGDRMQAGQQTENPCNQPESLFWTPRALAILEGSVKRTVNSNYWVERALKDVTATAKIVVSDYRYRSEFEAVKKIANAANSPFVTIRIERFETSPSSDPSERDLDGFKHDFTIQNKDTAEAFLNVARRVIDDAEFRYNTSLWI